MNHAIVEITPTKHGCIHACMAPLQSIVVAEIARDGKLLSANRRFRASALALRGGGTG